jgi:hypothetical protein
MVQDDGGTGLYVSSSTMDLQYGGRIGEKGDKTN